MNRNHLSLILLWLPPLAVALFFIAPPSVSSQDLSDEEILQALVDRAAEATRQYPWLVQTDSGLSFTAYDISREEFLRGVRAATALVFEGTDNLEPRLDMVGRYPNISAALTAVCREDPYLDCQIDFPSRTVRIVKTQDMTSTLSDIGLISRYRQVRIDPSLMKRNYGMHLQGMLIFNGSYFPPPFEFQIEPMPQESRVVMKVNGLPVDEFVYTDPLQIDQDLYAASSPAALKEALTAKLDQSWRMTARFPFGSTPEMVSLLSQQSQFFYGVVRSEPMMRGLRLHLNEGDYLDWNFPTPQPNVAFDGADAYQKAQLLQNQIVSGLSGGYVIFVSDRFGFHILEESYLFPNKMEQILALEGGLHEKEREIRVTWPDEAEWILEYFYTSLVPETWIDTPLPKTELIQNSDNLGPVFENRAKEKIQESMQEALESPAPLLPLLDLESRELPKEGRGLVHSEEGTEGSERDREPVASEIYFEDRPQEESNVQPVVEQP